jgi:hypothetical protein
VATRLGKRTWSLGTALRHYGLAPQSAAPSCGTRHDLPVAQWEAELWRTLTAVAYAYPDAPTPKERAATAGFFEALIQLLPEEGFRKAYAAQLALRPVAAAVESSRELGEWLGQLRSALAGHVIEYEEMVKLLMTPAKAAAQKAAAAALCPSEVGLLVGFILLAIAFFATLGVLIARSRRPAAAAGAATST